MMNQLTRIAAAAALALAAAGSAHAADRPVPPSVRPTPPGPHNIIIAHDAFVDGSGWRVVHDILYWKGYNVKVVEMGVRSLQDDDASVDRQIFRADGPVVLVGHGYGGSVITTAGNTPKVKALVYVAGFTPDVAETVNQLENSMPPAVNNVHPEFDGVAFFDPANFGRDYAGDLAANRTNYMAISQTPATVNAFGGVSRVVAWRSKPSYGIVATEDRYVTPELQRWMYQRAGSKITEIKASHAVYISQPEAVAKVIEEAALNAK